MSGRRMIERNVVLTIIVALMLSITANIFMGIKVCKYKYKIQMEAYNSIENIKNLHESNLQILSKAIDVESVDNMGVLKLYKNYSDLTEEVAQLWNEYIYYEENRSSIVSRKNIDTSSVPVNDINSKLEDFFSDMLELEMKTLNHKVEFNQDMLQNFKGIYALESEKSSYYNEFCENKLNGAAQDKKKEMIIKKHYWIDILEGYNDINKKYIDYEFKIS